MRIENRKTKTTDLYGFSADHSQGGPPAGLGFGGRRSLHGRRLHRPSGFRRGGHRPPARSRRLPRSGGSAAQLARRPARFPQVRHAAPLLRRDGRGHGLDGQPLYGQQTSAQQRRLHPGRCGGLPPRLRCRDLHPHPQTALSPHAGGGGRHRGSLTTTIGRMRSNPRSSSTAVPTC